MEWCGHINVIIICFVVKSWSLFRVSVFIDLLWICVHCVHYTVYIHLLGIYMLAAGKHQSFDIRKMNGKMINRKKKNQPTIPNVARKHTELKMWWIKHVKNEILYYGAIWLFSGLFFFFVFVVTHCVYSSRRICCTEKATKPDKGKTIQ